MITSIAGLSWGRDRSYVPRATATMKPCCSAMSDRRWVSGDCCSIVPVDIQGLYFAMKARELSSRTVRYTHAVVHSALEQAVRWRLLVSNPAAGVALPPQKRRREIRVLNPEEARRFLHHAVSHRYGLAFAVALTTGMRPSEYLALRWSDIDWAQQTVTVIRTLAKGSCGGNFNDTKRARSRRVIKLRSWIIDLLRRRHEEGEKPDLASDEQIFRTAAGRPVNSDYLARCFKQVLLAAGLATMRLYDLRHTAASLADRRIVQNSFRRVSVARRRRGRWWRCSGYPRGNVRTGCPDSPNWSGSALQACSSPTLW